MAPIDEGIARSRPACVALLYALAPISISNQHCFRDEFGMIKKLSPYTMYVTERVKRFLVIWLSGVLESTKVVEDQAYLSGILSERLSGRRRLIHRSGLRSQTFYRTLESPGRRKDEPFVWRGGAPAEPIHVG